mmetsp:Transcript_43601/g.106308  ORF Transcript_43601/g.106308 Transcript_43601/m.106308 type:complete len:346 (-) Transcript_43601:111-1148(-)
MPVSLKELRALCAVALLRLKFLFLANPPKPIGCGAAWHSGDPEAEPVNPPLAPRIPSRALSDEFTLLLGFSSFISLRAACSVLSSTARASAAFFPLAADSIRLISRDTLPFCNMPVLLKLVSDRKSIDERGGNSGGGSAAMLMVWSTELPSASISRSASDHSLTVPMLLALHSVVASLARASTAVLCACTVLKTVIASLPTLQATILPSTCPVHTIPAPCTTLLTPLDVCTLARGLQLALHTCTTPPPCPVSTPPSGSLVITLTLPPGHCIPLTCSQSLTLHTCRSPLSLALQTSCPTSSKHLTPPTCVLAAPCRLTVLLTSPWLPSEVTQIIPAAVPNHTLRPT